MINDNKPKFDLVKAFPLNLEKDVRHVLSVIPENSRLSYLGFEEFKLSGETLYIPYRIYYDEPDHSQISSLTVDQQTILFTLYTRHHNGFVRENNVKRVVSHATENIWIIPYIMLLIGEYVEEILQVIHDNHFHLKADFIKKFISENPKFYRTVQSRVVSYWDCYYRRKYPTREKYVGFQILDYLRQLFN